MESQEYNFNEKENKTIQEEEIPNIDQFQVERSGAHDSFDSDLAENSVNEPDPEDNDSEDDSEYSEDEVEFADGEGTLLNEEFENEEEDED
ncbi:MAG: hypothetical protein EOO96_04155 [Pedobacter sp.]|nr:MAG: hypothetical protein EOO96_04155 [Pedobacter sp.]